jgi:hypothetical protein
MRAIFFPSCLEVSSKATQVAVPIAATAMIATIRLSTVSMIASP